MTASDTNLRTRWDFTGQSALVTGGSQGIGHAIAALLARSGANVVITARKEQQLREAARGLGDRASYIVGKADDPDHARAAVRHCVDTFGAIDLLVNNAATTIQFGPLQEAELAAVDKVWAVNQRGPLVFVQEAWSQWMKEHGGAILNVASFGGLRVTPNLGAYDVSKAALIYMTQQLALDMSPGVRVNSVAPARVLTHMATAGRADDEVTRVSAYPLGRLGQPDDIAHAAAYLLSRDASWVTGTVALVDGGLSLRFPG